MRIGCPFTLVGALPLAAAVQAQPATIPGNSIEAASQISNNSDRGLVEEQLSHDQSLHAPVTQIATTPKTPISLQATPDRSIGRTGIVVAIGGKDRCDPAVHPAYRTKACDRVIETRADEFGQSSKTELTPEQRLMLTREIQGAGENIADATRRLAGTGSVDNSENALRIAATVLNSGGSSPEPTKPSTPTIDPATQGVIDSIVNSQQPPPH